MVVVVRSFVLGAAFGAILGYGLYLAGVPGKMIGPITGSTMGALIPMVYMLSTRFKTQEKQKP